MEENYMYGLSTIDVTENKQMVRAAGGLLCYMQNNRLQFGELDETDVLKCIKVVKSIALYVYLQWCTLPVEEQALIMISVLSTAPVSCSLT